MFNFVPIAQNVSVCLRCQYRLSTRRATRRTNTQRTTTPQQLRGFVPSRKLKQEQSLLSEDVRHDEPLVPPVRKVDPDVYHRWEEIYVARTGLGVGGRQIYSGSKNGLGFNALGEPAEVLVLRDRGESAGKDSGVIEIRPNRPDKNPAIKALSLSDMLDEINGERGLVDLDQVCKNIENVKTEWMAKSKTRSNVHTATEYAMLSSQLLNGFTVRQLATYLDRAGVNRPNDPLDLRNDFSSSLYTRSAWTPGTTPTQQTRAPKLVEPGKKESSIEQFTYRRPDRQLSHKSTLVETILRHCWQIKVRQDEALEGELQIRLHAIHLTLIMNHKRGILKQISENYGAKVEASRRDQIMRITSDYDTCLDILKLITFTLGNTHSSKIDLPITLRSHSKSALYAEPDNAMLRQVEKLTNTVIETKATNDSGRQVHIHYLGPDDADLGDARRLISQIIRPKSADKGWLIWSGALNPSQAIPAPVDVGNGLPLMYKDQQWSRWCSPNIRKFDPQNWKPSSTTPLNTLASPLHDDQVVAKSLTRFFAPPEEAHETATSYAPYWQSKPSHLDSAVFGQVLFSTAAAEQKAASIQAKTKGAKDERLRDNLGKWRREFVTQVPGMFRLFEPLGAVAFEPNMANQEFLQIRLTPSFRNTALPVPLEVLPNLEIRILLDNNSRTASVKYVGLVHSKQFDLLMPQNTVDLRFFRKTCLYWQPGSLDPRIQQFVHDSNLDIWGTERLRTPTALTLDIPHLALRSHTVANHKKPQAVLAEYTFTSLEHHSELRIPFRANEPRMNVMYTSIEAGKIGGRRDELVLGHCSDPSPEMAILSEKNAQKVIAQSAVFDKANSASLLRKANALINTIENRPDYDDRDGVSKAFAYGPEIEKHRKAQKAKSQEEKQAKDPARRPGRRQATRQASRLIRPVKIVPLRKFTGRKAPLISKTTRPGLGESMDGLTPSAGIR